MEELKIGKSLYRADMAEFSQNYDPREAGRPPLFSPEVPALANTTNLQEKRNTA